MKDFKKFNVFQKTRQFNRHLYTKTSTFPADERFGLTSQIRRATISIAANFAEGCGRNNDKEFARFMQISYASACEVECLLVLANDLNILDNSSFSEMHEKLDEIKKMLFGFYTKLKAED